MIQTLIAAGLFGLAQVGDPAPVVVETVMTTESLPGWMAGCWMADGVRGARTEECWTVPRGEMMLGSGHSFVGGQSTAFEHMRIVTEGRTLVFFGQPGGVTATRFTLIERRGEAGRASVTFENREHDYPQRIVYAQQEGGGLQATISLADGSRANSWTFRRAGAPTP
ncbi:MAG: DUF6265 family protein [Sphingopyxis sp.]